MPPKFIAIMAELQAYWQQLAYTNGMPDMVSEVIMDDIMIFETMLEVALNYFEVMLEVLSF